MYVRAPEACQVRSGAFHPVELELQMGVDPPHEYWELDSSLLQEQQVLLTTKSFLQPRDTVSSYIQSFAVILLY